MVIIKVENETNVIRALWEIIDVKSAEAFADKRTFRIGFSGGSLINYLSSAVGQSKTNWSNWQIYFCDERVVNEQDPDSTYGQYKREFISKTKLEPSQIHAIDPTLDLKECARSYEETIYKGFGITKADKIIPSFDLLLLGMGPDGHTCSLFPDHKLLLETEMLIAPIDDSPKPPPKRITMTYPLINNSKLCVFALSGRGKADMVKRIISDNEKLPAGLVKPHNGTVYWILDQEAASKL